MFVTLLLIATSCDLVDLDDPTNTNEPADEPMLAPQGLPASMSEFNMLFHGNTEKSWSTISFTIASMEGFQGCRLDDSMIINADGTYAYNGGSQLCGAEDTEENRTGTWRVNDSLDQLTFDEGTERSYNASLDALVQDTLVVSGTYIGLEIRGIYVVK